MRYFSNKFSKTTKCWGFSAASKLPLTFDFYDLKLRDFAKLWLFKLIIVVVVINFISGLLNNINNKENNSKPEKAHSKKTIIVENAHIAQTEKNYWQMI